MRVHSSQTIKLKFAKMARSTRAMWVHQCFVLRKFAKPAEVHAFQTLVMYLSSASPRGRGTPGWYGDFANCPFQTSCISPPVGDLFLSPKYSREKPNSQQDLKTQFILDLDVIQRDNRHSDEKSNVYFFVPNSPQAFLSLSPYNCVIMHRQMAIKNKVWAWLIYCMSKHNAL